MGKWRLGDFTIERVIEFEAPVLDPYVLYPDATEEAIDAHRHWLEPGLLDPESGLLILAFHSFVIRTPRHIILVDTCGGNDKNRPDRAQVKVGGVAVFRRGRSTGPQARRRAAARLDAREVELVVHLGTGRACSRIWTCDLSGEYVRINAEYTT